MKTLAFITTIALASSSALALTVSFEPAAPTSLTPVIAHVTDTFCGRFSPYVNVENGTITIGMVRVEGGICIAALASRTIPVDLGLLPGGEYRVRIHPNELQPGRSLTVRGDDVDFKIDPWFATVAGGATVLLHGEALPLCLRGGCGPPVVKFDGEPAEVDASSASGIIFAKVPAHRAGPVDVTVQLPGDPIVHVLPHAFFYIDPSAPADPRVFERVLFPVTSVGTGQFGSNWVVETVVQNTGLSRFQSLLRLPELDASGAAPLTLNPSSKGEYLDVPRAWRNDLQFGLRARDISRIAENFGTSIPVVGEDDFRSERFALVDIPTDDRYRHTLRVYSTGPATIGLAFISVTTGKRLVVAQIIIPVGEDFASLTNFVDLYPRLREAERVNILLQPASGAVWAFVSITNNDTQQVTVVTPN